MDKKRICQIKEQFDLVIHKYLEDAVAEKNLDIPVHVDSLIVLSAPRGTYIHVKDNYRKEKYCFRTELEPI